MPAIYYLDMHDVLALHRRQLERFGGAPGIRVIEAALARPSRATTAT